MANGNPSRFLSPKPQTATVTPIIRPLHLSAWLTPVSIASCFPRSLEDTKLLTQPSPCHGSSFISSLHASEEEDSALRQLMTKAVKHSIQHKDVWGHVNTKIPPSHSLLLPPHRPLWLCSPLSRRSALRSQMRVGSSVHGPVSDSWHYLYYPRRENSPTFEGEGYLSSCLVSGDRHNLPPTWSLSLCPDFNSNSALVSGFPVLACPFDA